MKTIQQKEILKLCGKISVALDRIMTSPTAAAGYKQKVMFLLIELQGLVIEDPGTVALESKVDGMIRTFEPFAEPQGCRHYRGNYDQVRGLLESFQEEVERQGYRSVPEASVDTTTIRALTPEELRQRYGGSSISTPLAQARTVDEYLGKKPFRSVSDPDAGGSSTVP